MTTITSRHITAFANAFIDERRRFYRLDIAGKKFIHCPEFLRDEDIAGHLEGRHLLAVIRADVTKILAIQIDGVNRPACQAPSHRQYEQVRRIMPLPLVFGTEGYGAINLFWLLEEEVPTDPALGRLRRHLEENGVKVSPESCAIKPCTKTWLPLPLGQNSVLLDPGTLRPYEDAARSVPIAMERIQREPRHRAMSLLRLMEGFRERGPAFSRGTISGPRTLKDAADRTSDSRYAPAPAPMNECPGLTERDVAELWNATRELKGLQRYRHLEFLFSLILEYKRAGEVELDLPRNRLVEMPGAHSDNFNERLNHAVAAGLLVHTNPKRQNRHPRRYRLNITLEPTGHFQSLDDYLRTQPLEFLSPHMQRKVKRKDPGLHGK